MAYERFERTKRIIKKFPRQKIIVYGIDDLWSIDLADFSKNNYDFKYVLFVIDAWSKYLWISFLKSKTSHSIITGLKYIFKSAERKPEKIMSDMESGLFSKETQNFLKENNIFLYHTNTGSDEQYASHNPLAERVIRTIKLRVSRYFSHLDMKEAIISAVNLYNVTKHSTIKMSPTMASKEESQKILAETYIKYYEKYNPPDYDFFKKGDRVRIYEYKKKFSKSFEPNWTEEIFVINHVFPTKPLTFSLVDQNNEKIEGRFYAQQMSKTVL